MVSSCHRHDMTDELWNKLEPLLIGTSSTPGVSGKDNRKFINAVLWILRTGAPWRDLPQATVIGKTRIATSVVGEIKASGNASLNL